MPRTGCHWARPTLSSLLSGAESNQAGGTVVVAVVVVAVLALLAARDSSCECGATTGCLGLGLSPPLPMALPAQQRALELL